VHIERHFDVGQTPDVAARLVANDETLLTLFPEAECEIVASEGQRRTLRTRYRVLGQQGTATFHFEFLHDLVRFEKVCDGRVWRELSGTVTFRRRGKGTRVVIEADGRTRTLVPEFTIRGPMTDQIEQMAAALRARIEGA
jgi:hypothetical protein